MAMKANALEQLCGSSVLVEQIILEHHGDVNLMTLIVLNNQNRYKIQCHAVTAVCINCPRFPMWVEGFEVVDNQQFGWQSDSRYRVYDFEENTLSLYCEEIHCVRTISP